MPASDLRGDIILQEPEYNSRGKQSRHYQYALGLLVMGVMMLLLSLYMKFFLDPDVLGDDELCLSGPFVLVVASVSFISLMFSVYFYLMGKRRQGVIVYENGISYPSSLGFNQTFYPYAEFKSLRKEENFIQGNIYVFELGDGQSLALKQKSLDLEKHMDFINDRIANPREVTEVDLVHEKKSFRKSEALWYIVVAGLALLMTMIISLFAVTGVDIFNLVLIIGYLGPIIINTAVFITALRFIRELSARPRGFGIDLRVVASIFAVSLLIFFGAIYATWYLESGISDPDVDVMEYPGTSILTEELYEGQELDLGGPITLAPGQNLTIRDCTIVFNCTSSKEFGIWTDAGSKLVLINTTVRPCDKDAEFYFELHGSARLLGCEFYHIWADTRSGHENGDGGLKIHNDDVLVEDCLISECKGNGMLIDQASPRIINSTIEHCGDDGIEILGGAPYIYGNRIQYNSWGVISLDNCRGTLDSNAFIKNDYGLSVMDGEMVITNNHFIDQKTLAFTEQNSDNIVRNNQYVGKKPSAADDLLTSDGLGQMCLVGFFMVTLVSLLILYVFNRRIGMPPLVKRKKG